MHINEKGELYSSHVYQSAQNTNQPQITGRTDKDLYPPNALHSQSAWKLLSTREPDAQAILVTGTLWTLSMLLQTTAALMLLPSLSVDAPRVQVGAMTTHRILAGAEALVLKLCCVVARHQTLDFGAPVE